MFAEYSNLLQPHKYTSLFSDVDKELTNINEWFVANKQKMKTNIRDENISRMTDMIDETKSNDIFKNNQSTYQAKTLIVMIKVRTKKEKLIVIQDDNMIKLMDGWETSRELIDNKKFS